MAKVQTDLGAVASAVSEFFSWLKYWMAGQEVRKLKAAARTARSYIKRSEKLFPKIKKDKALQRYRRKFETLVI